MEDEHARYENLIGLSSPWTWRDRWRERLFPTGHASCPDPKPEWNGLGDVVTIRTYVKLSWSDRLRILFTGQCRLETRTACEHEPGGTVTHSDFWVVTRRTD